MNLILGTNSSTIIKVILMKLDPKNPSDRKFLETHKDKSGKTLMQNLMEANQADAKRRNELYSLTEKDESKSDPRTKRTVGRYGNKRTFIDNQWFDSGYEGECWMILKYELVAKDIIYDLSRSREDCEFLFIHNNITIAKAKWDFSFSINGIFKRVIADAKSPSTIKFQRLRWQKQMMLAFYELPVLLFLQGQSNVYKEIIKFKDETLNCVQETKNSL